MCESDVNYGCVYGSILMKSNVISSGYIVEYVVGWIGRVLEVFWLNGLCVVIGWIVE